MVVVKTDINDGTGQIQIHMTGQDTDDKTDTHGRTDTLDRTDYT